MAFLFKSVIVISDHSIVAEAWLLGPYTGILPSLTQGAIIRGLTHTVVARGVRVGVHTISIVLAG